MPDINDAICLSFDVEWASAEVMEDVVGLMDEHGVRGTFFCTHDGVKVPGHERGIHPNFRFRGDTFKSIRKEAGAGFESLPEAEIYERVLKRTLAFAPESSGSRSHSLFYDSLLMSLYPKLGLKYDSSYFMPLQKNIRRFEKEFGVTELPIYYIDFYDLKTQVVGFELARLKLDQPGLKILDFHPNLIFANISSLAEYGAIQPHYSDAAALLKMRGKKRGARTLFIELLQWLQAKKIATPTLAELAAGNGAG